MRRQPKPPPSFPALVQAFFVEHLTQQRALSPQTVAAYRDAFMLFLGFAESRLFRLKKKNKNSCRQTGFGRA